MSNLRMLKKVSVICIAVASAIIIPAYAQKYKTAADTADLNKEYAKLTVEITDLQTQLTTANDKLPGYQTKSTQADQDAQKTAQESKSQAVTAAGGNLKQINKEEKKAKQANNAAEDAKDAQDDVKGQQKKIKKLNADINKKQKRLTDLGQQRAAIMALSPSGL